MGSIVISQNLGILSKNIVLRKKMLKMVRKPYALFKRSTSLVAYLFKKRSNILAEKCVARVIF